jgi:N-acyl-D-amino-acid deacylase
LAVWLLTISQLVGADRPVTGWSQPAYNGLDSVMTAFMDFTGLQTGTLAVAKNGEPVYMKAFGWADSTHTTPATPVTTFRIASNTKPLTSAVVRHLVRSGKVDYTTRVYEYLGLQPFGGTLGDNRIPSITVDHLLRHRGGWNRSTTYDPMYRLEQIRMEMGLPSLTTANVIEYMWSKPLQFAPGSERQYSNFGYLVLGRVVEKAAGKPYKDAVQELICEPLGIDDIRLSATRVQDRHPSEVHYPHESGLDIPLRDSVGGFVATPPSLCKFLRNYWITGEPRRPQDQINFTFFGSQPNSTTSLTRQRMDGVDYAVILNGRRNGSYNEDNAKLLQMIDDALTAIGSPIDNRRDLE